MPVGLVWRSLAALFIAQMRRQFGAQHSLHQLDLELFHQPGIAKEILRPLAALQKFIQ